MFDNGEDSIYIYIMHFIVVLEASISLGLCVSDVTVLLSLTVFLNTVSESMPNTSDAVPLIST